MQKNIMLINPWIYDFAAYDFWIKPMGLLYLASILRANGNNVQLVDCLDLETHDASFAPANLRRNSGRGRFHAEIITTPDCLRVIPRYYRRYGISPAIFLERLKSFKKPDLIFITSMMTYWYPGVREAIKLLRQTFPKVPVVLGGNYVTLCPEHASTLGADITISGEGEKQISLVFNKLFGRDLSMVPDGKDIDCYPYPAYDLLTFPEQVHVITSKGCPFRCSYCASSLLNAEFRQRDPIKVVDEISFWHKNYGITNFSFYDDALLVAPQDMIIPLLKEIIRRKLPCQYHCPNGLHLRGVTPELSELMFKAGFKTIRFGFESSNRQMQVDTGGKVNNDELAASVNYLNEAGYKTEDIGIYLLCGLPRQESSEVKDSILFVKSCGAKPILAEYSPIPGTVLWNEAVASSPFDLVNEPLYHNNSLIPCRWENLTYDMYSELKLMTKTDHVRIN